MLIDERRGDAELSSKRKWWRVKGAEAGRAADHTLTDETTRRNANNETSGDVSGGKVTFCFFRPPEQRRCRRLCHGGEELHFAQPADTGVATCRVYFFFEYSSGGGCFERLTDCRVIFLLLRSCVYHPSPPTT